MKRLQKKTNKIIDIKINFTKFKKLIKDFQQANDILIKQGEKEKSWLSTSNIVGEWAELIVCSSLHLIQQKADNKGYDAKDRRNKKYQIKSRWYRDLLKKQLNRSGTHEFGYIKKEKGHFLFDYLILVYFKNNLIKDFQVYKIKASNIDKLVREKVIIKKDGKYIIRWNEDKFKNKYIANITNKIKIK